MIINFIAGKMVITHSTGFVDEYDVPYLEDIKVRELEVLACCQANCDYLDECIANAAASGNTPQVIE